MDLSTLGFSIGSAWLAGINLYATVLVLGLVQYFHWAQLPGTLSYLGHPWVVITAGALYVVQFIADKIPVVDSAWDLVHTFIRIPAGAILAVAAVGHLDPKIKILALLVGGGVALSSHSTKTATRLAANTSPEPVSNVVLSFIGDAITAGGALLMSVHPVVLLVIVVIAMVISVFLIRWVYRGMRRLFGRRRVPAV
jgi:hypothetical protein